MIEAPLGALLVALARGPETLGPALAATRETAV